MVVIEACSCDEGLGLPHTHVPKRYTVRRNDGERTFTIPEHDYVLNKATVTVIEEHGPTIRIWINWRDFGEAVLRGDR